jgi:hypothetical protein
VRHRPRSRRTDAPAATRDAPATARTGNAPAGGPPAAGSLSLAPRTTSSSKRRSSAPAGATGAASLEGASRAVTSQHPSAGTARVLARKPAPSLSWGPKTADGAGASSRRPTTWSVPRWRRHQPSFRLSSPIRGGITATPSAGSALTQSAPSRRPSISSPRTPEPKTRFRRTTSATSAGSETRPGGVARQSAAWEAAAAGGTARLAMRSAAAQVQSRGATRIGLARNVHPGDRAIGRPCDEVGCDPVARLTACGGRRRRALGPPPPQSPELERSAGGRTPDWLAPPAARGHARGSRDVRRRSGGRPLVRPMHPRGNAPGRRAASRHPSCYCRPLARLAHGGVAVT